MHTVTVVIMLTDADRENVMKLVLASKTENLITSTHFMDVSGTYFFHIALT